MWNDWFGSVSGFENVDKKKFIEWPQSDLFDPVLQRVTDAANIVTSDIMKKSGSNKQENK